ncbi:MAG: AMP-binding protein, partial [Sphingomonas sp.]
MPGLPRPAAHRIACAIVAAEVRRIREADPARADGADWHETTPIGEEGLALDSLERLGALGALSEAFDLDDGLLADAAPRTVGDWVDWIMRGHAHGEGRMMLATSGSTGAPKLCPHPMAALRDEAAFLATRLPDRRRVVALVPAHHIYGIIWTALLPAELGLAVVPRALGQPLGLAAGDLVVAVPEQWRALLRLVRRFPDDVIGVSSGGPLDDDLASALRAAGLARIVDIYGSSETGGIAMRDAPATSYDLLPRWRLGRDDDDWHLLDADGRIVTLPDHVERTAARALRPIRRRDGAVQVAGRNVWPEQVADVLRGIEGVAEAAVRLHANGRLKAFVVPAAGCDAAALPARVDAAVARRLDDHARPTIIRYGVALPRNAMGQ